MKKGFYMMLEGGEGCGKDSHAKALIPFFKEKGYGVTLTKEPDGIISKVLKDKNNNFFPLEELFLFEADRAKNYREIVKPSLDLGKIVIKTRGWPSTLAYQGFAGSLDMNLIYQLNKIATQNIMPDLLIILDVNARKGLEKEVAPDRFAEKGLNYHEKVNKAYRVIAEHYPDISVVVPYIENGFDEMQKQIRNEMLKLMK